MDCIFCKIINGEIPCNKIYEDERTIAFLDIFPTAKGHTLVLPKRHAENLIQMDERDMAACMSTIKKIADGIVRATGSAGFNLGMNNGRPAGQTVMHAHFHIIPRKEGDGMKPWPQGKYSEGEMDRYHRAILSELEGKKTPY